MSRMPLDQTLTVRNRITEATKNGRLQDWNERIGEIATLANMDLSHINWVQSPDCVARDVVTYANMRSNIESLELAIAAYLSTH